MKYTNEINTIIEKNALKGNITVNVMLNKNNDCIIIYTTKNGLFYISFVGTKYHMVFNSYEEATKAAINFGYLN